MAWHLNWGYNKPYLKGSNNSGKETKVEILSPQKKVNTETSESTLKFKAMLSIHIWLAPYIDSSIFAANRYIYNI